MADSVFLLTNEPAVCVGRVQQGRACVVFSVAHEAEVVQRRRTVTYECRGAAIVVEVGACLVGIGLCSDITAAKVENVAGTRD